MANNVSEEFYVNIDLHYQQLLNACIENSNYSIVEVPSASSKGRIYYDTILGHFLTFNGTKFEIVANYKDLRFDTEFPILKEKIWADSTRIPMTFQDATSSAYVEKVDDLTLQHIAGTYSFRFPDESYKLMVPTSYSPTVYVPVLKSTKVPGFQLVPNYRSYRLEYDRVTFLDGFDESLFNPSFPPSISFWKYTGRFGFLPNETSIVTLNNTQVPYNEIPLVIPATDKVDAIYINGLRAFSFVYSYNDHKLIINQTQLGYNIDNLDYVYAEIISQEL